MIRAFRDTWELGIHSYLTYLRDRLLLARELLHESGSCFVQIGDENLHHVVEVLGEVLGSENFVAIITFSKTTGATPKFLPGTCDYLVWFVKNREKAKFRTLYLEKILGAAGTAGYTRLLLPDGAKRTLLAEEIGDVSLLPAGARVYTLDNLTSQSEGRQKGEGAACWFPVSLEGKAFRPSIQGRWKTNEEGMANLALAFRLEGIGDTLRYVRFLDDFPVYSLTNVWGLGGLGHPDAPLAARDGELARYLRAHGRGLEGQHRRPRARAHRPLNGTARIDRAVYLEGVGAEVDGAREFLAIHRAVEKGDALAAAIVGPHDDGLNGFGGGTTGHGHRERQPQHPESAGHGHTTGIPFLATSFRPVPPAISLKITVLPRSTANCVHMRWAEASLPLATAKTVVTPPPSLGGPAWEKSPAPVSPMALAENLTRSVGFTTATFVAVGIPLVASGLLNLATVEELVVQCEFGITKEPMSELGSSV
jgi:hypothetical protein